MPHKILEGRQHTAPEGCLCEKSTRRSPKKSIITDKKQKLLQQLLRAGNIQHPKGVSVKNQPAVAQRKSIITDKMQKLLQRLLRAGSGKTTCPVTVFWPMNGRRGEYPACIINFLTIDKPGTAGFVPGPQIKSSGIHFYS